MCLLVRMPLQMTRPPGPQGPRALPQKFRCMLPLLLLVTKARRRKPKVEQEDRLLKWMAKHDEVWRRGHRLYKKRKEIWGAKAAELGVSVEHIMGWWKSIKDWYVRLNKVKSGQAAKRYTDREQLILDNCKFYRTQLPSTVSAPMASLQRSEPIPQESVHSEPDSDHEPFDDLQVAERTSAETGHTYCSESRPIKKRKRGEQEEEKTWMKNLRETLKANQELLAHLIQEKPAQSSEHEVFIKYVSDSLHAAPAPVQVAEDPLLCSLRCRFPGDCCSSSAC